MGKQAWARCILFGLVLYLTGFPVRAGEAPPEPSVTVAVHDDVGVPTGILAQAERTASEIFKQAGLNVAWVNCGAPTGATQIGASCQITEFPTHLHLRIARRSKNLRDSVFGVSFLAEDGSGCYSDVFLEPAEQLHEKFEVSLATLLGHVAAHEIAHLLLGTNSHSSSGIMRARWNEEDLAHASRRELLFTAAQGRTMRERVGASLCPTQRIAAVVAGTD